MHAFFYVIKVVEQLWPASQIFFILENAGSMQHMHSNYLKKILNLEARHTKNINSKDWSESTRNRFFSHQQETLNHQSNKPPLGMKDGKK
jgi:hypothetical protein